MQKADRNDKFGIENYGTEKWNQMCDYRDDRESRKEKLFAEASKPEQLEKLFGLIEKLALKDFTPRVAKNLRSVALTIADIENREVTEDDFLAAMDLRKQIFIGVEL